jgi:hypothetical protein
VSSTAKELDWARSQDAQSPAASRTEEEDLLEELEDLVRLAKREPPERRITWFVPRVVDFIDRRAIRSAEVTAIHLAYAFRNFATPIRALPEAAGPATAVTIGKFAMGWFVALLDQGSCVSPPRTSIDTEDEEPAIVLDWRCDDRTLEVRICGESCEYVATWFDGPDRKLMIQDGPIGLDPESLGKTISWLSTGQVQ